MTIKTPLKIGQVVYLITDEKQLEYMIVALIVLYDGIRYRLCHGSDEEIQVAFIEISETKIIK